MLQTVLHRCSVQLLMSFLNGVLSFAHCVAPKTLLLIGAIVNSQQPIRIPQTIGIKLLHREQNRAHNVKEWFLIVAFFI